MASTFSNLKIELIGTGDQSGTWGTTTNTNLGTAIEEAITGRATANFATDADLTLGYTDTNAAQVFRNLILNVTSGVSLTATRNLIVPTIEKQYLIENNTTGAQDIVVKTVSGTGITVPNGRKAHLYANGTDVVWAFDQVDINGGTIDNVVVGGVTPAAGAFTTVDTTNIEVTNIKAKDGTAAASIADSTGKITVSTELAVDNLNLSGNTLSSTDTNGNIVLAPNGTGDVQLDADTVRIGDSNANATLTTNGTGDLILNTNSGTNSGSITIADGANGDMTLTPNGNGSVVITNNGTSNALRITQTGSGNALVVEDSANPDSSPFVIDGSGSVVQGATTVPSGMVGPAFAIVGSTAYGPQFQIRNKVADVSGSYFIQSKDRAGAVVVSGDALGNLQWNGYDGANYIASARLSAEVDGTPGTNDMPGRLTFSTTADGASSPTERMRIDSAGNVGIGGAATAGNTLVSYKAMTGGGGYVYAFNNVATVNSDATVEAVSFQSFLSTQAASFTAANLRHFKAYQSTIGAGSTVTNQVGYFADASLTGATNNYGFFSNIASGTGRWNFYANGTASNFFGGNTVISVADNTNAALRITQTGTGDAILVEDSANPDSSPFVVDASGNVVVGNTSTVTNANPATGASTTAILQLAGVNIPTTLIGGTIYASANTTISAPYLSLGRSNTATVGSAGVVSSGDLMGGIQWHASDGTSQIRSAQIQAYVDGTPGTNDMPGRLVFSTTADGASSPTERMRIDNAGRIGIGTSPTNETGVYINQTSTAVNAYGLINSQTVGSTTTNFFRGFQTGLNTTAASFTLSFLNHFYASQGTFGAGSTVTNQYGYFADASLTGATNNYGFLSNIASGTGRWNFYAAGTAANYFAGSVGIGATAGGDTTLNVAKNITGAATAYGVRSNGTIQSDVTTTAYNFISNPSTVAAAFTLSGGLQHFTAIQGTIGAGSAIANQFGFNATSSLTGATNNYGFYSDIASGTGRWNFYANGTAQNYFEGLVGLKTTANNGGYLEIGGTANVVSNSGYGVTQYQTIPSTATSQYWLNTTVCSTAAASFTLSDLRHYNAGQGTFGAGSTVTSQYGFFAQSNLTGATNNYGFYSNIASGTNRWNFYANGTADNYFAGSVGIGGFPFAGANFVIPKTVTGATNSYQLNSDYTVASDVTSSATTFFSYVQTQAAAFTLGNLRHFFASQRAIGAGSTITNQYGFVAESTLTGATNNYGFYSNIASGTNRWNFYANGTADNYFDGRVGIGAAPESDTKVVVGGTLPSNASTSKAYAASFVVPSSTTVNTYGFLTYTSTSATAFTLSNLYHYAASQGTIGAGSAITTQYGFHVGASLTGATNNFGFYSNIASGAGRYNFYANGTASNYFAGDMQLDKTVTATGTTGAQTINKNAGTVNFAAAATSLVVTDSRVTANSIIICTVGTNDSTMKSVAAVAGAGSFTLHANAAATAETRVNFLIIN